MRGYRYIDLPLIGLMLLIAPMVAESGSVVEHFRIGVGVGAAKVSSKLPGQQTYKATVPTYTLSAGYAVTPDLEIGVMVSGSTRKRASNGISSIGIRLEPRPSAYIRARKFGSGKLGVHGLMTLANVRQRTVNAADGNITSKRYLGLGLGAGVSWKVTPKFIVDAGLFMQGIALTPKPTALSSPGVMVSLNYAFGDNQASSSHQELTQSVQSAVMTPESQVISQPVKPAAIKPVPQLVTQPIPAQSEQGLAKQELSEQQADEVNDWIMHMEDVHFGFDGHTLNAESLRLLDRIAEGLKTNPALTMEIVAHTDNLGSALYNLQLSFKRERAVKAYLLERGVPEWQLKSKGYGAYKPIADNTTEAGRAKNRRVEMNVYEHSVLD